MNTYFQPLREELSTGTTDPDALDVKKYQPIPEIKTEASSSYTEAVDLSGVMAELVVPIRDTNSYFQPDHTWEGMVLEVRDDVFRARLVDVENTDLQEEAEIIKSALTDSDDLRLLVPGAIFYWTIGRRISKKRSEQVSMIQFRRLPEWTNEVTKNTQGILDTKKDLGW